MVTTIGTLSGSDSLEAMLRQLPGVVQQDKVLAQGLKAGGKVIRAVAAANLRANGDVETGLLADTMIVAQRSTDIAGLIEVSVRPSSKLSMVIRPSRWGKDPIRARPSKYAHFIEMGTERQAAHPFMRPAFDTKKGEAAQAVENTVRTGIAQAMGKVGLK
jgi:HK97 gp10 family phage protein